MSLKFGLYLVQQGILTCDQFCGLVGIQQALLPSPAAIALRKNMMSIRQIAKVFALIDSSGQADFLVVAQQLAFLSGDQAEAVERWCGLWARSIEDLLVDCRVLSAWQVADLKTRFEDGVISDQASPLPVKIIAPYSQEEQAGTATQNLDGIPAPKFKSRPTLQVEATT
jgi:hypothetical protein